jgi:hypothetical protein
MGVGVKQLKGPQKVLEVLALAFRDTVLEDPVCSHMAEALESSFSGAFPSSLVQKGSYAGSFSKSQNGHEYPGCAHQCGQTQRERQAGTHAEWGRKPCRV